MILGVVIEDRVICKSIIGGFYQYMFYLGGFGSPLVDSDIAWFCAGFKFKRTETHAGPDTLTTAIAALPGAVDNA